MTSDNPDCKACGVPKLMHNGLAHEFSIDGQLRRAEPAASTPGTAQPSPWPFDPVLRVALINLGIIKPEDIISAEETLRASGGVYIAPQS